MEVPGVAWAGPLVIPLADQRPPLVLTARIKPGADSCYETWVAMGAPHNLSVSEEALLRAHATPAWTQQRITSQAGSIAWDEHLEPGAILFVEVRPVDVAALPRDVDAKSLAVWDAQMVAKSH